MTEIIVKDEAGCSSRSFDLGAGFPMPRILPFTAVQLKEMYEGTEKVGLRDDDVMLCTFPKCGTNWMFEVMTMMLTKDTELTNVVKLATTIECTPADALDKMPSPRVINTHLTYKHLPTDMKKKQTKTVLFLRNPKAVAYSYYKHYTGITIQEYDGQWRDWLPGYLKGQFEYGKYTDYLRGWQSALDTEVGFPLHIMYYEDMKKDYKTALAGLAEFLGVTLSTEVLEGIMKNTSFENMQANKLDLIPDAKEVYMKGNFGFFRKGQVADWKNGFTVQQDEVFNEIWKKETKGFTFQFQYE